MNYESLYDFLTGLISTPTITGFEGRNSDKIAQLCLDFSEGFFEKAETLPSGSLLFERKCGKESAKKIVLDAHMDTIGFIVTQLCDDGFVKVTNLGGVDPYILPATPVRLYGKKEICGVFSSVPPHLSSNEAKKNLKISDLYVDTGLTHEKLCEYIDIGTPVGFENTPQLLQNGIIASHSLDDKACVAAAFLCCRLLMENIESVDCDVYVHLAVGEEKTALGARTLPYSADADACIVLDVNFAVTKGVEEYESLVMGGGAGVSLSVSTSLALTNFIVDTALAEGLTIQSVVEMQSTGTNATRIHRGGIPSAVLSIPLKNMHTCSEEVCLDDIICCGKILARVIAHINDFGPLGNINLK